jgi:hypothetical protein|tara:strand:- start:229 stop:558 length:330 start_codon:yes stop_codon:yes gene_type:complete
MEEIMITEKYANKHGYTDVEPFEVVEIKTDKKVVIRALDCKELEWKKEWFDGGFAGHLADQHKQKWDITSNKNNHSFYIRKHKSGEWKDTGGNKYTLANEPRKFYDFNF